MNQIVGNLIRHGYSKFERWRNFENSRKEAFKIRGAIVRKKGYSIVDKKLKNKIKKYSERRFGNPDYWHWLAVYSEIREEFLEGWIPEDIYAFHILPKTNPRPVALLSNIKTFDHRLFRGFSIDPLAIRISNQFFDSQHQKLKDSDFKKIMQIYNNEVVIKRDGAPSGAGVLFKQALDVKLEDFNPSFDYVVQPVVKQHKKLQEVYSHSINTIRIVTYFEDDGSITVKYHVLKFGLYGNRIDNVNAGGLFLIVDSDGNVSRNAFDKFGFKISERHPDTNYKFDELIIPSFKKVVGKCKQAHELFPYLKIIGWDVFIDEMGKPKLIEWNARHPDIWIDEALVGPLWPEWKV